MRGMRGLILIPLIAAVACGYSAWYVFDWWKSPLPIGEATTVTVETGDTVGDLAERLMDAELLDHPRLLRWMTRFNGLAGSLKVGEYAVTFRDTPQRLMSRIVAGDVVYYHFRIAEGAPISRVLAELRAEPKLSQTLGLGEARPETLLAVLGVAAAAGSSHGEGWFFPDTYRFVRGDQDRQLLLRAHAKMREELAAAWASRATDLPYRTPYEALIVASIVEKESGRTADRAHISQVIAARSASNMRLQVDPAVIYGLGEDFDGNLTRADLKRPTPYNTYVHRGLPPTPIGLPSRDSLRAAVHPSGAPYLYFVAKGDGSSQFSTTLQEHLAAVNKYQRRAN